MAEEPVPCFPFLFGNLQILRCGRVGLGLTSASRHAATFALVPSGTQKFPSLFSLRVVYSLWLSLLCVLLCLPQIWA
jgi:hypothetical protein